MYVRACAYICQSKKPLQSKEEKKSVKKVREIFVVKVGKKLTYY